jgi:hypothetical protein
MSSDFTLTKSLGHGWGRIGTVTDHGDGTYTALFTGTLPGDYTLSALVRGKPLTSPAAALTVTPGTARQLGIVVPKQAIRGGTFSVTAVAADSFGNPDPTYTGSLTLALVRGPKRSKLSGVTSATATAGQAVFTVSLNQIGAGYRLQVRGDGLPPALSSPITVAPTTHFSVTGVPSRVQVGQSFVVTITALTARNAVDGSYLGTVHFTSTDPLALLPADYTFRRGNHGKVRLHVTLESPGRCTIAVDDVTKPTAKGTSAKITVKARAVDRLFALGWDG